jgi:hypothetical protein
LQAFDQKTATLYVTISQLFSIWFVPFYDSHVILVTVLNLSLDTETNKYTIVSQQDHYQTNEVVKFFWPGGNLLLLAWQNLATFFCIIGAILLSPITMLEQRVAQKKVQ